MQVIVVYCCGAHYKESVTLQGCDHRRLKHGGLVMMASCIVDLNFTFFFLHNLCNTITEHHKTQACHTEAHSEDRCMAELSIKLSSLLTFN